MNVASMLREYRVCFLWLNQHLKNKKWKKRAAENKVSQKQAAECSTKFKKSLLNGQQLLRKFISLDQINKCFYYAPVISAARFAENSWVSPCVLKNKPKQNLFSCATFDPQKNSTTVGLQQWGETVNMFRQVVQSEAFFKEIENNIESLHLEMFSYNEVCPISFSAECLFQ